MFYYFRFAGEGAYLGGEGVEIVESAVVAVGRDSGHVAHLVEVPRGEDEEAAVGTGLEASELRFPIGTYGLFLQVDERVPILNAFVLYHLLAA